MGVVASQGRWIMKRGLWVETRSVWSLMPKVEDRKYRARVLIERVHLCGVRSGRNSVIVQVEVPELWATHMWQSRPEKRPILPA